MGLILQENFKRPRVNSTLKNESDRFLRIKGNKIKLHSKNAYCKCTSAMVIPNRRNKLHKKIGHFLRGILLIFMVISKVVQRFAITPQV